MVNSVIFQEALSIAKLLMIVLEVTTRDEKFYLMSIHTIVNNSVQMSENKS